MKRVYLIRHGLPDFPEGKRMCLGHTDLPLSLEGRGQAEQMAAGLPPVTSVFSSPLSRAVQTAQAIRPDVTVLEIPANKSAMAKTMPAPLPNIGVSSSPASGSESTKRP